IADVARFVREASGDGALADAIARAVALSPAERYPTARAFAEALAVLPRDAARDSRRALRPLRPLLYLTAIAAAAYLIVNLEPKVARRAEDRAAVMRIRARIALFPFRDSTNAEALAFAESGCPMILEG